jgi:hypothetical protein
MRVTVIPEDRWICRDADAAVLPEWPFDDAAIHAIQWKDATGELEHRGRPKPANTVFTDFAILQPYIDALEKHLAEIAKKQLLEAEALIDEPA